MVSRKTFSSLNVVLSGVIIKCVEFLYVFVFCCSEGRMDPSGDTG